MPRKRLKTVPQKKTAAYLYSRNPPQPTNYRPSGVKHECVSRYVWSRDIGLIIKAARVNLGYSRNQLGILTDNSYAFMQNIEDGGIDSLKADTVLKLCQYLHLTIEKIFPQYRPEDIQPKEPPDFW